jgi:hypothetical protein
MVLVEVDLVEEKYPPNFNPPLTKPNVLVLVKVREIFSESFPLFIDPHTMLGPVVSSSMDEPSSPSTRVIGGIPIMPNLKILRNIGPTPSMFLSIGTYISRISVMSSFQSTSLPRISTPIPSISMPTCGSPSIRALSLGFIMGSGILSIYVIPMSSPIFLSVGFPFGWNIPSGFGIFPSQFGCSNVSRAPCPSDNTNVWGPQGSSRMYETSYSS